MLMVVVAITCFAAFASAEWAAVSAVASVCGKGRSQSSYMFSLCNPVLLESYKVLRSSS